MDPSLVAGGQSLDKLETNLYWLKICPHLSVGGTFAGDKASVVDHAHSGIAGRSKEEFVLNGFFHLDQGAFRCSDDEVTLTLTINPNPNP